MDVQIGIFLVLFFSMHLRNYLTSTLILHVYSIKAPTKDFIRKWAGKYQIEDETLCKIALVHRPKFKKEIILDI